MNITFIDLKKQYIAIQDEINTAVHNVIAESAFVGGKYVEIFEQEFAHFCNAQHCVGVGNGTDALYLALRAWVSEPGMKSSRQPIRSLPPRRP